MNPVVLGKEKSRQLLVVPADGATELLMKHETHSSQHCSLTK